MNKSLAVSQQYLAQLQTQNMKKKCVYVLGGWSYKNIGYGHLQMFSRTIKSDCSGNWIRMIKYVYFINEVTDTSKI